MSDNILTWTGLYEAEVGNLFLFLAVSFGQFMRLKLIFILCKISGLNFLCTLDLVYDPLKCDTHFPIIHSSQIEKNCCNKSTFDVKTPGFYLLNADFLSFCFLSGTFLPKKQFFYPLTLQS